MATQVQFRRGTTTENNAFTGAAAELTVDTTLTTLRVHDGTTAGGVSLINANSSQVITNKTYGNGNTWEGNAPTLTYGGTGKALTAVQGGIVYSDADSMEISLAGTAGQVLTSGGTAAPIWVTPSSLTVGTASVATTASNIAGGSAGYLVYQFDTDDTSFIEPGATGYVLQSTGASTAPSWVTSDLTIGSTAVTLGDTVTDFAGLTSIDATTGATNFFTTPTGSTSLLTGASAVTIGASTSTVTIADDLAVGGNLTVTGTTTFNGGTITLGDSATDNVVLGADVNSDIIPNTDGTYDLGSSSQEWQDLFIDGTAHIDTLDVDENATVAGTLGVIGNTTITADLAVNGGDLTTTASTFNLINTNATTANIAGAATAVNIGASTGTLTVNNAQTVFDSTDSIQIPVGTTAQRDGTPVAGQIRYNSTISSFEGYGPGNAWGSLGGVKDVDQDTYLLTEASAGSDEDTFEFYNAGVNTMALDGTALTLKNDTYLQFDTDATAAPASHSEGAVYYSNEYKTLAVDTDITGAPVYVGHQERVRVYNNSGSTISAGTPVYITGATGETPTVSPADASTEAKSQVVGIATNDISNASEGHATVRGLVSDIDTSALTAGDRVHVGPSGALQTLAPTYPYFPTDVGTCVVSDATNGYLYVTLQEHTLEQFRVTGNTHMDGNLTVDGDLTVNGTQTITSQANLALDNAFIYMNSGDTIGEANTTFSGSGLDDAYFTSHFEGTSSTTYYVRIDGVGTGTGGVDTFEWSKDNFSTTEATGVDLDSSADVALDNNIKIHFNAETGHTSGDSWSGTAAPLNTDTGWASNRNTGASGVGYTHLGVVWDTASSQFIVFDEYEPEIEGNINTSHASFSYGSMRMDALTATTGTFSSNGSFGGTLTVTGATTLNSNLDLNGNLDVSGNITSSSGAISFDNENLSTTGTLASGALTVTGNTTISGDLQVNGGDITSSTGAISFGNENLSTTGTLSAGNATLGTIGSGAITSTGAISGTSLNVSTGAVTAGSLDISGNADIDGTMEADAYTVNGTALNEYIADTVGAMVSSNSESGISVTYQDADNTLDFNVNDPTITLTGAVTGSATMTNLGNVSIATTHTADPTITLGGDLSGSVTLTNLGSGTLTATINANSVALGTDTTGNYVATVAAGSGITVSGSGSETAAVTVSHADTSSQASVNNSGSTFIQDITLDTYGHITGLTSATVPTPTASSLGLGTSNDVRFDSLGIGTAASGTTGEIRATGDITAGYSDERLKTNINLIPNALDKVMNLRGVTFNANDLAEGFGFETEKEQVGVLAQDVKEVLPQAVKPAPFDRMIFEGKDISKSGEEYMTVHYEKLVPLLIEAMKEQQKQIDELKKKLGE